MTERHDPDDRKAMQARIRALFEAARELPAAQREPYMRTHAHNEHEAAEALALLAAHDVASSRVLETAELGLDVTAPRPIPEQIGPYRILAKLGEGSMGVVYRAERSDLNNHVAVKVCQPRVGTSADEVLARFDRERRTLAAMSHRWIARVFDTGTSDDGLPWFAMELVDGMPLTTYCQRRGLSLRERLQLFQQVCEAVQHAHGKPVVHRDLKPANILVTEEDGTAVPKILDFGLAKALEPEDPGKELGLTGPDHRIGTMLYAAPEQVLGKGEHVDVRSDIYALGVILFELLCGELPFPEKALEELRRQQDERAVLNRLAEDDPGPPSRRVAASSLRRDLAGDLDNIVRKAMAKEPDRRYQTANALAEDIDRYLRHLPVVATGDSVSYRVKKFARRYRGQVLAVGALLVTAGVAANQALTGVVLAGDNERYRNLTSLLVFENSESQLAQMHPNPASWTPDWTTLEPDLDTWLTSAEGIDEAIEDLSRKLEHRIEPLGADEAAAAAAFREENIEPLRQQRAAWQRAADIATGRRDLDRQRLGDEAAKREPHDLAAEAWKLVAPPHRAQIWGQAARGLALAELALPKARELREKKSNLLREVVGASNSGNLLIETLLTVAWARAWNGQLDPAREAMEEAVALAAGGAVDVARHRAELLDFVNSLQAGAVVELARLDSKIRTAELELHARRQIRDRLLLRQLVGIRKRLADDEESGDDPITDARQRLRWARRVAELTLDHPKTPSSWQDAREAIAKADGVAASALYAAHPIDLQPQQGLVPLGKNPETGLWEFYHLRSAWNPRSDQDPAELPIPEHDAAGHIEVGEETGIVFVLIPGGTFTMGAQKHDASGTNFDEQAPPQAPLDEVTLEPFFIARHELTRGQWLRLSVAAEDPSQGVIGQYFWGMKDPISAANPVNQVSWNMASGLLARHGLLLPTEAQWEYAARAGSTTPWPGTDDIDVLRDIANLCDRGAKSHRPGQTTEDWNDYHPLTAPVGSFEPNAWGLYDVIGNVEEWCRDVHEDYDGVPARPGDGLRDRPDSPERNRVLRGGHHFELADKATVAFRHAQLPSVAFNIYGLRPTRVLVR